MNTKLLLFCLLVLGVCSHATILSVALDGSQPYSSIQTAINASAHTDTVLVYPGRYYENVSFNGKNIILGSLEMITGNRDYIYSTIIDANYSGSGIQVINYESSITIRGFTVVNGTGIYYEEYDWTRGGGILVLRMTSQRSARIINCHVTGNSAYEGAGMYLSAQVYLSGVSVHHNSGSFGAGIFYSGRGNESICRFEPRNRCSIYSNYAPVGSDLNFVDVTAVHVIVDTFTVANPWNFYANSKSDLYPTSIINPYTFDIMNTVHTEVNHDLYVAPWGDDNNSGLSPAEPMKSIFNAMYRIASDSDNPKTVHVANGTYSAALNGQLFPIPVKSHTHLIGESRDGVMLDSGWSFKGIMISPRTENCLVSTLSIRNCSTGIFANLVSGLRVDNIRVIDSSHYAGVSGISGSYIYGTTHISNVKVDNLQSADSAYGVYFYQNSGQLMIENVEISNLFSNNRLIALGVNTKGECEVYIDGCNVYDNDSTAFYSGIEMAMLIIKADSEPYNRLRIDLRNSAFHDNHLHKWYNQPTAKSVNDTLFISNCTFAGNSSVTGPVTVIGTAVLTNNIFNSPDSSVQIYIPYSTSYGPSHVKLIHNNILGGIDGVTNQSSASTVIWGEGNTAFDPLFSYEGNRPYTLSPESPLIDSGWQAAFSEPGLDAGGNERLWDGDLDGTAVIDKGAYEYQPIYSPVNLSAELWNGQLVLSWDMTGITRSLTGYRVYRNNNPHADIQGAQSTWFRERITQPDTLVYRVAALYGNVESTLSDSVVVIVTAVDNSDDLAPGLPTLSVGPNPFTDLAVIRYTLPRDAKVELKIYNLRGQLVRVLDSGIKTAGEQILAWEGCDDRAQPLTSGVYLLRLSVSGKPARQMKAVLVK